MAERWRPWSDIGAGTPQGASPCERVSALCARSVVSQGVRRFRMGKRSLSGTILWSGSSGIRRHTFATFERGRFGLTLHPDNRRVWTVCQGELAGRVRLPGLHALLQGDPERTLQARSQNGSPHRGGASQSTASRHMGGRRVCQGWFNYFAVPGRWLRTFRHRLQRLWMRAIRRRSRRHRFDWKRLERMTEPLWPPICHPWPDQRFTVKHPRPDRLASRSGSVRGVRSNAHLYRNFGPVGLGRRCARRSPR